MKNLVFMMDIDLGGEGRRTGQRQEHHGHHDVGCQLRFQTDYSHR